MWRVPFVVDSVLSHAGFPVSKTIRGVIVDHADSLHKRIADCRADEVETKLFLALAHLFRLPGFCRDLC